MNPTTGGDIRFLKTLQYNNNAIVLSSFRRFYHPIQSRIFAIRFVTEGVEHYTLNGQQHNVEAGKYLLSSGTNEGHIEIDSREVVSGLCVGLAPELIAEVLATMRQPDTAYSDLALGQFFNSSLFLDNQYNGAQTQLGQLLTHINKSVNKNNWHEDDLNMDFFYTLSERLIIDQIPIFKQLQNIPSVKSATKKDLYKRVVCGKEFIDACFTTPLSVENVAQAACLSEYHFFRLFKAVFGLSPHQYILQKRLNYAQNLLIQDQKAVSLAADASGFSDIFTFSKAFKKHFGYAPSQLSKGF